MSNGDGNGNNKTVQDLPSARASRARSRRGATGRTTDTARAPGGGQDANRQVLRVIAIGPRALRVRKETGAATKASPKSQQSDKGRQGFLKDLIEPPFELLSLSMLPEHSTALKPLIDAMSVNIDGFGWRPEPRFPEKDREGLGSAIKKQMEIERVRMINFFGNCSLADTFIGLRRKTRIDLETTGNGYWEVIKNPLLDPNNPAAIQGLEHVVSHRMRLTKVGVKWVDVEIPTAQVGDDGTPKLVKIRTRRRFRRYAQLDETGREVVTWFKEFGDPRRMHARTGKFEGERGPDGTPTKVTDAYLATEIFHWKLYCARSPYGLPRTVGNLITIYGDRAADEVNYITLSNNNIPSMMLMVSNGMLTDGTIKRIEEFVAENVEGSANYSRILIVEADPAFEGPDAATPKIAVEKMSDQQLHDALFQQYSMNNATKLRQCFRLPPLYWGGSDDYTRATADASKRLADEQVFDPERRETDALINKHLLPTMGIELMTFMSQGPNVTNDQDLIKAMGGGERSGGVTPRIAHRILSDIMGRELPPLDPSIPQDVPFSLTMAERVKNLAKPNEPGQQVTALKAANPEIGSWVELLTGMRQVFEDEWEQRLLQHPCEAETEEVPAE